MKQPLSAEKYIQTRARHLPIYKCLVNAKWESVKTASVFVIRSHSNGNFTWGGYAVDLLCRGIIDTDYDFNILPQELDEWLEGSEDEHLIEIDYTLAHNIIFAGYDFAMDFHINPHPDFMTVTRFLLEEDDDKIPLIDITTGDNEEGLPHLIVNKPGEQAGVLSKLKQYAGEGNYYYTILERGNWEEQEEEDEDDFDNEELNEDEFDEDKLDPEEWDKEEWVSYITDTAVDHFIQNPEAIAYIHRKVIAPPALNLLGLDREELIHKALYGLTREPVYEELTYHPSMKEKLILRDLHERLFDEETYPREMSGLISEIQKFIRQWPANPVLRNYLFNAYTISENREKAMDVITETRQLFPEYLFGKTCYAHWLILQKRASEVPAVFNGYIILSYLYPERKLFHFSEFIEFTSVWLLYYLEMNDTCMAGIYGEMLEYCPPGSMKKLQKDLLQLLDVALLKEVLPLLQKAKTNLAKKYELASLLAAG